MQFPEMEPQVGRAMLSRFPYAVFFLVEEEVLAVFAFLHLHRDPDTWKDRK